MILTDEIKISILLNNKLVDLDSLMSPAVVVCIIQIFFNSLQRVV